MVSIARIFKRALAAGKTGGISGLLIQIGDLRRKQRERRNYQVQLRRADAAGALRASSIENIRKEIARWPRRPLISVVLPVYNVPEKWLRFCIDSVTRQFYANWELCIADDASTEPHIRKILEEYAALDARVKVFFREENGHISAASNSALEMASGEFTVLLDHDDELAPLALYYVAKEINAYPQAQMIYSDEDLIDEKGRRSAPKFKPDWSPDFFYSLNLVTHLSAYRTEIIKKVGGFRLGFEGSQDYDLALRVTEQIPETAIRHIPVVLYHWRAIKGSVALDPEEKPYAHDRAKKALSEHFERKGISAKVTKGYSVLHKINYDLPAEIKVSVICAAAVGESLKMDLDKSSHKNIEIIDAGDEIHPLAPISLRLNLAAKKATGDILIFLENDVKSVADNWVGEMASLARQKEIGTVGAKLLYKNGTIHHGGIVLGVGGSVGFAHRGFPADTQENILRAQVINNFSAVSGACMATRKQVFLELGGFDEENFANGLYDVDYCLRLREKGCRIVWTPYAELIMEDKTATEKTIENKNSEEVKTFQKKWEHLLGSDPYYNPNLSLSGEVFSIRD